MSPYKDKGMKSQRQKERRKGEAPAKMKPLNEAPVEMVGASYIPTTRGEVEFLPERPRYMDLGAGQILDRAHLPKATGTKEGMLRANEAASKVISQERAERYKGWRDGVKAHSPVIAGIVENRGKLERICLALKHRGLLNEVQYGVYGPSFKVVGDWLDATDRTVKL